MKKRVGKLAAGCVALSLLGGTWAFYSSTNSIDNQMKTLAYGDTLHEKFTPDDKWQPGEEATKEVGVKNTGDYDLVVRVKLNEHWWRDGNANGTLDAGEIFTAIDSVGNSGADRTKMNYVLASGASQYDFDGAGPLTGANDGLVNNGTNADETVVYKKMLNIGTALTDWTLHTDGWWYYNGKLAPGAATSSLMDSIMLAKEADMGKYNVVKYYTVLASLENVAPNTSNIGTDPKTQWVIYTGAVPSAPAGFTDVYTRTISDLSSDAGYAGAVYDLIITSQTCQATADAVAATFPGAPSGVVTGWSLT